MHSATRVQRPGATHPFWQLCHCIALSGRRPLTGQLEPLRRCRSGAFTGVEHNAANSQPQWSGFLCPPGFAFIPQEIIQFELHELRDSGVSYD